MKNINNKNIAIIATITAKSDSIEHLDQQTRAIVPKSRAEAGCVKYILHKNKADPQAFIFYEVWQDQAAIDSHNASIHFKQFITNIEKHVENIDIKILDILTAED